MRISTIFTQEGFYLALTAYHKLLNEKYNFPPLKGNKPFHRMAELFNLNSSDSFKSSLSRLEVKPTISGIEKLTIDSGRSDDLLLLNYNNKEKTAYIEKINVFILVLKQDDRIYTTAHLKHDDAVEALKDTLKEDFDNANELTEEKEILIDNSDITVLTSMYETLHDDALALAQINHSWMDT